MSKWMKLAKKISVKGVHRHHQLGAVVVKGGGILGMGANLSRPYASPINRGHCAEMRALKGHRDYTDATIYVYRLSGGCSRPCSRCSQLIKERGLSKMVYVDWSGKVVEERI